MHVSEIFLDPMDNIHIPASQHYNFFMRYVIVRQHTITLSRSRLIARRWNAKMEFYSNLF